MGEKINSREVTDMRGASTLAREIETYWRERGYAGIAATVVPIDLGSMTWHERRARSLHGQWYGIATNIGATGYPPRKAAA